MKVVCTLEEFEDMVWTCIKGTVIDGLGCGGCILQTDSDICKGLHTFCEIVKEGEE